MGAGKDDAGIRILGIFGRESGIGAVEIYRILLPFTYLNRNSGMQCRWMSAAEAAAHLAEMDLDAVFGNDIVVLHRVISEVQDAGQLVDALKVYGARVVYEVDDDYSGRYRQADDVPGRTWAPYIGRVDAITTTTKHLAGLARSESGGKPVYVLPNAVDYGWFTETALGSTRGGDRLTVMVAGTRSHYDDWHVLADAMRQVLSKYDGLRFLAAAEWEVFDYLRDVAEFVQPVQYSEYPALLAQADILCIPLDPDDRFGQSRSPIKAIEGWCAARPVGKTKLGGCAVVASDCTVYRGTVQHRHNGLLVKEHTPEAWRDAVCRLVEDRLLRQKLQVEGLKDAKRYDIAARWRDWHQVYLDIVA